MFFIGWDFLKEKYILLYSGILKCNTSDTPFCLKRLLANSIARLNCRLGGMSVRDLAFVRLRVCLEVTVAAGLSVSVAHLSQPQVRRWTF